jgi:6-phosphofructokinase 1
MKKEIKKIGVLTSGGDSPGMNAAIRAVVRTCAYYGIESTGIYRGYQGLIEGDFINLDARSVRHIISRGGTILKSARSEEFRTKAGRQKAYKNLMEHNIDALVLIGGDGTFTGGVLFQKEFNFPVIGVPGTIDNDIFGTNFTIGYDTALNTVVDAIDKIRDTATSHNRLFFVEVMGRDSGFIALNSGIGAGAEDILIPEENIGIDVLLKSLKRSKKAGKTSSIIVVSEGDQTGENVFELAKYINKNLPEYETKVSVLGHMQRGGSPSCFDRVMASRMAIKAVETIRENEYGFMVGIQNNKMTLVPLEKAIKGEHAINKELLRMSDILTI